MRRIMGLAALLMLPQMAWAQETVAPDGAGFEREGSEAETTPVVSSLLTRDNATLNDGYSWLDGDVPLMRGRLALEHGDSIIASQEEGCRLAVEDWGWNKAGCGALDAIVMQATPAIDTLVIEKPNSNGYVSFDDWKSEDRAEQIEGIWESLTADLAAQSNNLGVEITADDWLVYPTLNEDDAYLYYATRLDWGGDPVVNIKATRFDRQGYLVFNLVPVDDAIGEEAIRQQVETILGSYVPGEGQAYADFMEGDKVAAAGAVGVLAALTGVKLSKAAGGGLFAVLALLAKKFWFVLLAPLAFLKNLFRKKPPPQD